MRDGVGPEWVFIRDTWENMRRSTQREFFHWFPPGVIGDYAEGKKEFVWRGEQVGLVGRVTFMGVDDEADASKLASMPLGGCAIDEPSPATGDGGGVSRFVFQTAMMQLRQRGLGWYAMKLAQNNPDESHWTYEVFWDPGTPQMRPVGKLPPRQVGGFRPWQTREPENVKNLPAGYYEGQRVLLAGRDDLIRRFVEGKHGHQQVGRAVTPEWSDDVHLSVGLEAVRGVPLQLLWDGGHNPTCIVTQVTPLGSWLILEAVVGDGIGMVELIEDVVKPRLTDRFRDWFADKGGPGWRHIGDPALESREQSSILQSAALVIRRELGGSFIKGPVKPDDRVRPLRAVLRKLVGGRGLVQVDRVWAKPVWHALRGGWHNRVGRTGGIGEIVKDIHSHPGDAVGYGAAVLFPVGRLLTPGAVGVSAPRPYFTGGRGGLGFERPGFKGFPRELKG
ncbi:MAG: hypothetical protein EA405_13600 [Rhodospirillales bacterium]|nr:MAG: hypothetical protein EA405_13600 [Rhodospirillales bacterium]